MSWATPAISCENLILLCIRSPNPFDTFMAIEELIKPDHNVLELGSGGSTIFFSRRCKSVKSYETTPIWEEKVRSALPNPSNVVLFCGKESAITRSIRREPDGYYDWLIVDSAPIGRTFGFRFRMMGRSIPKLKIGGFMVVDNYDSDHPDTCDAR